MSDSKKKVPKRRFEEFSNANDWELRKLGEVVQITMGQSPNGTNYTDNPNDYILVQGNADMKNGQVVPRVWTKQITKTAAIGDIILSVRAPVGDVGKTNYNVVLGRGVAGIKGDEFIYQVLFKMRLENYWAKYSTGSTFESINSNDLKEAKVFVPKELEKKEIGMFFKQLDNTIALHQRKLEKIKALKTAYLSELFPAEGESKPKRRFAGFTDAWEQRKLGEVTESFDGKRVPIDSGLRVLGEYPYYGATGIIDYVDDYIFDGEYVLLAEDGANIIMRNNPVAYLTQGKFWLNNHAHIMRMIEGNNCFLVQVLEKIDYIKYNTGTAQPKLNSKIVKNIEFKLPQIEEQQQIGAFFKQLDDTITLHQRKLKKLQNIKKAYLNEMFI